MRSLAQVTGDAGNTWTFRPYTVGGAVAALVSDIWDMSVVSGLSLVVASGPYVLYSR